MRFLDTSFLVDYLKNQKYTLNYLEENEEEAFYASSITFYELYRGEYKIGKENLEGIKENLNWLKEAKFDNKAAEEAAEIESKLEKKGEKINLADVIIAGTAKSRGSKLVSTDTDFTNIDELKTKIIDEK